MMYYPTTETGARPTLSDAVSEALHEGQTVELTTAKHGFGVVVDGTEVAEIATESFDYPLDRVRLDREAEQLVEDLIERRNERQIRERKRRRMRELSTAASVAAHGVDLPGVDG